MTSKFCLAHEGQDIIVTPLFLIPRDFRIWKPALTSSTGSADNDTLMVSPIPDHRSFPKPIEDWIVPYCKLPASVIPIWRG